jgi:DNA-binding NtrC family response regulator
MARVLIVEDEPHMRRILASNLQQERHIVAQSSGVAEARSAIAANDYDVLITDQKMGDGSGLDVLASVRENDPSLSVIFLTAVATVELAVESMRQGAFDFLTKPFLPEILRAAVGRAAEHTRLMRENGRLKEAVDRLEGAPEIVGESEQIKKVREQIVRVAPTNAIVLITGETGTGKELVARALHKNSPRSSKPFIAINCAAFTETLLESELFGHERGAFTGADRSCQGVFEAAHEGTLFLDEIGEMALTAQAKLLRVVTDGQVTRVGSTKPRAVDVRVLAATHRDLQHLVRAGSFREDLYYRLAVVPIDVPPLRERGADIPLLCELFLRTAVRDLKLGNRSLNAEAINLLRNYSFPGNIRELRNLIERACILANTASIGPDSFPVAAHRAEPAPAGNQTSGSSDASWLDRLPESIDLRELLTSIERKLIERALKASDGAQAEAARRLALSRSDLSYKLSKYELRVAAGKD